MPSRIGLLTYRVVSRCFFLKSPPHGLCTARKSDFPAAFLILYKDFTEFNDYKNFTNEAQNDLISKMLIIDSNALSEGGFWQQILDIDRSIRNDFLAL